MDDIRKEYTDTLKEIVRLESQIAKLKQKYIDLENKMSVLEKEAPPHLDKDGCVYWDQLIKKEDWIDIENASKNDILNDSRNGGD